MVFWSVSALLWQQKNFSHLYIQIVPTYALYTELGGVVGECSSETQERGFDPRGWTNVCIAILTS